MPINTKGAYRYITLKRLDKESFRKNFGISHLTYKNLLKILYQNDSNSFKSKNFKLSIPERLAATLEYFLNPLFSGELAKKYGVRKQGLWYSVRWVVTHLNLNDYINHIVILDGLNLAHFTSQASYLFLVDKSNILEETVGFTELAFNKILKIFISALVYTSNNNSNYHIYADIVCALNKS